MQGEVRLDGDHPIITLIHRLKSAYADLIGEINGPMLIPD